eukprot:COSAG01_NODE_6534_length_3616_cov_19.109468_6_plen_143_part_00
MQQRGKTCWGEGDYDHRANRERGASISYAPLTPRRWWSGTRGTAAPMHLGSGRGGAAGCGSRHTPLGGCSGIASGGYRSGQLQQQQEHASANSDGMSRMRRLCSDWLCLSVPCCSAATLCPPPALHWPITHAAVPPSKNIIM